MVSVVTNEEEYKNICKLLLGKENEVVLQKDAKYRLKKKAYHFIMINKVLYLKDKEGLHKRVFHSEDVELMKLETTKLHKEKHYGFNRFEEHCNQYFFKIPREIVREVVTRCTTCAQAQPLKVKETQVHILAQRPMERLMIDLVDMQKYKDDNGGYAWILTVIDVYSKFAWAFPLFKKSGFEVTTNLEAHFYRNTGPPVIIQSDNGKEFINKEMKDLCNRFLIDFKHSRPRHPQANGQIERFNQTLSRYLQKHIFEEGNAGEKKIWIKHLNKVLYDYNLAKHSSTKRTPFSLRLRIPGFNTLIERIDVKNELILKDLEPIKYGEDENLPVVSDQPSEDHKTERCELIFKDENNLPNTSEDIQWDQPISKSYLDRMDRNSLVHLSKYDITIGDKVMVAKDFDNNTKTKKHKLSSFFSIISEVTELLSN
ncbi:Gag-Pol polyprotein, partial [Nosema granulosis]